VSELQKLFDRIIPTSDDCSESTVQYNSFLMKYNNNNNTKKKTASHRNLITTNLNDVVRFKFHYIRTKTEIKELSGSKR
jgi:hypothetical protein